MDFSNIPDTDTALSYESIKQALDEIKAWRDDPKPYVPEPYTMPPMPFDIYKELSALADSLGEPLEYVQACVMRGIYGKTADGAYMCRIPAYRAFEREMQAYLS